MKRTIRFGAIICMAFLLLVLASCEDVTKSLHKLTGDTFQERQIEQPVETKDPKEYASKSETVPAAAENLETGYPVPEEDPGIMDCAYQRLDRKEKQIYYTLLGQMEAGFSSFHLSNVDTGKMETAYQAALADHPELFWLGNGYSWQSVTTGERTDIVLTPVTGEMDQLQSRRATFDQTVNEILHTARSMPSAFETICFLHDYLVEQTQYDNDAMISIDASHDAVLDSSSAYGCLVNKKAICSGYSAAFQYLAQQLGYPCIRVRGEKNIGESHEWNIIQIDGEWYHMDVTWDDPVAEDGSSNSMSHEYFCITTDELLLTHSIDAGQQVPVCSGEDYDYYRHNGYFLDFYSLEEIQKIFAAQNERDLYEIKFSSAVECETAKADLFDNGRIFEISERIREQGGVDFSTGSSGLTLDIFLQ